MFECILFLFILIRNQCFPHCLSMSAFVTFSELFKLACGFKLFLTINYRLYYKNNYVVFFFANDLTKYLCMREGACMIYWMCWIMMASNNDRYQYTNIYDCFERNYLTTYDQVQVRNTYSSHSFSRHFSINSSIQVFRFTFAIDKDTQQKKFKRNLSISCTLVSGAIETKQYWNLIRVDLLR